MVLHILLMKRRLHMPGRKIVGFLTRKRIWFHILRMAIVIAVSRSMGLIVDWNLPGTSLRGEHLASAVGLRGIPSGESRCIVRDSEADQEVTCWLEFGESTISIYIYPSLG